MSTKKEKEDRSKQCGQLLVDFVNAKTPDDACRDLLRNVRDEFKFDIFVGPSKRLLKENVRNDVEEDRSKLKRLFSELKNGINLNESEVIHNYLLCYDLCCKAHVSINKNGYITVTPVLDKHSGYDQVLAYCIISFLELERSRKLIHRCKMCNVFFIPQRIGNNKFCPGKNCRRDFHNRNRIKSGEAKEYKRKKRAEGAPKSYYG